MDKLKFTHNQVHDWNSYNCNQCQKKDSCRYQSEIEADNVSPQTWEHIGGADRCREEIDPSVWRCYQFQPDTKGIQVLKQRNFQLFKQFEKKGGNL